MTNQERVSNLAPSPTARARPKTRRRAKRQMTGNVPVEFVFDVTSDVDNLRLRSFCIVVRRGGKGESELGRVVRGEWNVMRCGKGGRKMD